MVIEKSMKNKGLLLDFQHYSSRINATQMLVSVGADVDKVERIEDRWYLIAIWPFQQVDLQMLNESPLFMALEQK